MDFESPEEEGELDFDDGDGERMRAESCDFAQHLKPPDFYAEPRSDMTDEAEELADNSEAL